MAKCYRCNSVIKVPKKIPPNGRYLCRRCYFRQLLKKKLKFWKR